MADQNQLATGQLLELLLQLKKAGPAAAKQILNQQPPIAYALITLMVNMNVINFDVFHKTLADYSAASAAPAALSRRTAGHPPHAPTPAYPPAHTYSTPPAAYPPGGPSSMHQPAGPSYSGYGAPSGGSSIPGLGNGGPPSGYPPPSAYSNHPPYGAPPPTYSHPPSQPASAPTPAIPGLEAIMAAIPDDQKAMIMRVVSMTPEQLSRLPPNERASFNQLRATLGLPTG
ncbi:hypothetical protein ONZ45_g14837 [Pleurotus djamor]|nr:hypothetical protein ONZ45_g14837 [Pleurotus djamor]